MNIADVLNLLGYDIISFNENGEYKVMLGHDRQKRHGYCQETWILKILQQAK